MIALLASTSALAQQHIAGGSLQLTTAGPGSSGAVAFLYKNTEHGVPDNVRVIDFELHKADLSGSPNPDCNVELWLKDIPASEDGWPAASTQTLADFQQGATRVFQGTGLALPQAMGFVRFQQTERGLAFDHTTGHIAALVVTQCATPRYLMWKGDAVGARGRGTRTNGAALAGSAPFSIHRPQARLTWLTPGKHLYVRVGTTVIPNNGRFAPAMNSWAAGVAVPQHYQLWNFGQDPITLGAIAFSAQSNLAVTGAPAATTIPPGSFVALDLTVTPTAAGAAAFDITLPTDDPAANPMKWGFVGTAKATAASQLDRRRVLPDGTSVALADNQVVDLGSLPEGDIVIEELLSNYGSADEGGVTVTAMSTRSGAAPVIELAPMVVHPQEDTRVRFRIHVKAPFTTTTVSIATANGPLSSVMYKVVPFGPEITLQRDRELLTGSTDALEVSLPAGTQVPVSYAVVNLGSTLMVTAISLSDVEGGTAELVNSPMFPFAVETGAAVQFTLGLTSTAGDALSLKLTVNSNDFDEAIYVVNLERAGPVPRLAVFNDDLQLANGGELQLDEPPTAPIVRRLVLRNLGDAPLTVSSVSAQRRNYSFSKGRDSRCAGRLIPSSPPGEVIAPGAGGTPFEAEVDASLAAQDGDCGLDITVVSDDPSAMPFVTTLRVEPAFLDGCHCASSPGLGVLLLVLAVLRRRRATSAPRAER